MSLPQVRQTIVIIPGLGHRIDTWKETQCNQQSVYEYLVQQNHQIIGLELSESDYQLSEKELLDYMNSWVPINSILLAHSFGCVMALLYSHHYSYKIKGVILLEPTTQMESYRLEKIENPSLRTSLLFLLQQQSQLKNLNFCPIINHVIIPFKKLMNPHKKITDGYVFEILNTKFMFLKLLSSHPHSNIIIYPNGGHLLYQKEAPKIKASLDYLLSSRF